MGKRGIRSRSLFVLRCSYENHSRDPLPFPPVQFIASVIAWFFHSFRRILDVQKIGADSQKSAIGGPYGTSQLRRSREIAMRCPFLVFSALSGGQCRQLTHVLDIAFW